MDLTKATGSGEATEDFASKLSRVVQLTGFSDPVYAEAYVHVHQFDINLGAYNMFATWPLSKYRHAAQTSSSSIRPWTPCRT
jgi:vesicle coat complex subunit